MKIATEANAIPNRITLAVDTSQSALSLALARDAEVLASIIDASGLSHSQRFFPLVAETLESLNLSVAEIDCFVVNTGPGSFTGLRVGIAAVKGVTSTLGKPLFGISAIDATALTIADLDVPIIVLLNATRGEMFYGVRKRQMDLALQQIGIDQVISFAQLQPEVAAQMDNDEAIFIGNGAADYWPALAANRKWRRAETPSSLAPTMAIWASRQAPITADAKVEAYYIRPSDAEVKLAK